MQKATWWRIPRPSRINVPHQTLQTSALTYCNKHGESTEWKALYYSYSLKTNVLAYALKLNKTLQLMYSIENRLHIDSFANFSFLKTRLNFETHNKFLSVRKNEHHLNWMRRTNLFKWLTNLKQTNKTMRLFLPTRAQNETTFFQPRKRKRLALVVDASGFLMLTTQEFSYKLLLKIVAHFIEHDHLNKTF